jgi:hypothetical protein
MKLPEFDLGAEKRLPGIDAVSMAPPASAAPVWSISRLVVCLDKNLVFTGSSFQTVRILKKDINTRLTWF